MRIRRASWCLIAGLLALNACAAAAAQTDRTMGLRISAVARSVDLVRVTGTEPNRVAMPGAEGEVSLAIPRSALAFVIGGGIGGSWYFEEGPGYRAKTSYTEWRGHAGAEGTPLRGTYGSLHVAALADYGELRSWLENQIVNRSGPRAYYVGGGLRLRAVGREKWQLRPTVGLQADVYRAHGDDTSTSRKYAWIGSALTLSLGLQY